jgi:hypothetical protein
VFRSDNVWQESILYNFLNGADGGHPYSGVTIDGAGISTVWRVPTGENSVTFTKSNREE